MRVRRPILFAGLLAGLLTQPACGTPAERSYLTAPAEVGALSMEVTAVGTLQPLESVDIGSALSGTVAEVLVEQNQRVSAGQVLARLDAEPFEIAVSEARAMVASASASVRQAEASLEKARQDLERSRRLAEQGAASEVELLSARTQLELSQAGQEVARAQLLQAVAGLERAERSLGDAVIESPIDGVVLRRAVEPGQTVVSAMSAATLFTVASDLSRMKAEVDIDEADVARLEPGQRATFTVSAWPERRFDAAVARVDLAPDPASAVVVYVAELHLDNPDGALRPGMTVTASVETGRLDEVVLVPSAALRFTPEGAPSRGSRVWTLEGAVPAAIDVEVLGTDGVHSAVSGLGADVEVITGVI
jgi:HlyD family secretion protein